MDRYTEVAGFNGDIAREFMKQIEATEPEDLPTAIAMFDDGEDQDACSDSVDAIVEYGGEDHRLIGNYVVVLNERLGYVTVYRDEQAAQSEVSL